MNPEDEDKEEEFFTSATPVFQVSYSTDVSMLPFVCLSCLFVCLFVSLAVKEKHFARLLFNGTLCLFRILYGF